MGETGQLPLYFPMLACMEGGGSIFAGFYGISIIIIYSGTPISLP